MGFCGRGGSSLGGEVVLIIINMNKLQISLQQRESPDESTWLITHAQANRLLVLLRSDYFREIRLTDVSQVSAKELKFLIQIMRLLTADGRLLLDSGENQQLNALIKALGFHDASHNNTTKVYLKTAPPAASTQKEEKLAIGFHSSSAEQQIDEDELLQGEGISIKKQAQACETKPRACANCSCGRKDVEVKVSKEELVKSVNEGNPVSGCGKCFLGDSFRCGTCPYKGLPAFKPGDRLKLQQDGGVQVEAASTFVSVGGKVKLQL